MLHSYSIGNISGQYYVGGLAGYNEETIEECYSQGTVSGNSDVGGFMGSGYDDNE